jgi:hypothetical protein
MSQALKTYSKGAPFYNVWVPTSYAFRIPRARLPFSVMTVGSGAFAGECNSIPM